MRLNLTVAPFVVAMAFLVLSAIQLDHEPRFKTRKIGDITADWRLAAKTIPANLAAP